MRLITELRCSIRLLASAISVLKLDRVVSVRSNLNGFGSATDIKVQNIGIITQILMLLAINCVANDRASASDKEHDYIRNLSGHRIIVKSIHNFCFSIKYIGIQSEEFQDSKICRDSEMNYQFRFVGDKIFYSVEGGSERGAEFDNTGDVFIVNKSVDLSSDRQARGFRRKDTPIDRITKIRKWVLRASVNSNNILLEINKDFNAQRIAAGRTFSEDILAIKTFSIQINGSNCSFRIVNDITNEDEVVLTGGKPSDPRHITINNEVTGKASQCRIVGYQ